MRRRRFGEKTHFLFLSLLLHKLSISLFLFSSGWHKAIQIRGGLPLCARIFLSCFPPFRVALPYCDLLFVFPLLLSSIPTALVLFVCFLPGFLGRIFELCLRGMAFVVFGLRFYWIRSRAIWNYANVLIFCCDWDASCCF